MFDIPFEIFALFMALSLVFVPIGIATRKQGIGYMIMFTTGLFIAIMALTTDNIIMNDRIQQVTAISNNITTTNEVLSIPVYSYDVQSSDANYNIDAGGTNGHTRAEFVSSGSSALVGDIIECINIPLADIGTVETGATSIEIGTLSGGGTIVKSFGTLNPTVLTSAVSWHEFCLPDGEAYAIQSGDRIGVRYNAGTTNNGIQSRVDGTNPFDSTVSYRQAYVSSWTSNTAQDITMQLYRYDDFPSNIVVSAPSGAYSYENNPYPLDELPKTLFVLLGGFILFAGAVLLIKDD